nr:MAG TPA: hypothetical protein [Crassvirales sp.]
MINNTNRIELILLLLLPIGWIWIVRNNSYFD